MPIKVLVSLSSAAGPAVADSFTVELLVVALCAAVSFSVALVAGGLAWRAGANPAGAVLRGGAAFGGPLALALAVAAALGGL